jgi:hypothetical protein
MASKEAVFLRYNKNIMDIEKEILLIKERNKRVEADKAWEKSGLRIFLVSATTYIIASLVLYLIGAENVLLSALVPTVGYYLSTQSLPVIKKWWTDRYSAKVV